MDIRLTPLAAIISSSFILTTPASAAFSENGAHGSILHAVLATSSGTAGTTNANAQGQDGADLSAISYALKTQSDIPPPTAGVDAIDASSKRNAGGIGGAGGGTVFGALSQGGAGGYGSAKNAEVDGSGGAGGAISRIDLNISQVTLTGARAGDGGSASTGTGQMYGGGGSGGSGGGSIIGALSIGGASGSSQSLAAQGGVGGDIADISISVNNVTLIGADGGRAGSGPTALDEGAFAGAAYGGGGIGGAGGGSVFGGVSLGGASGETATGRDDNIMPNISSADAGDGGHISNIHLDLSQLTLEGANGGLGAGALGISNNPSSTVYSASGGGIGGAGGGSVLGAYSAGGGAGSAFLGKLQAIAKGGDGGHINNVSLVLVDASLIGGHGADGGSVSVTSPLTRTNGSGGTGGLGGGLISGGVSLGGGSGYAGSDDKFDIRSDANANGGDAGSITEVDLRLNRVKIIGGAAGNAGSVFSSNGMANGSGGTGGAGGGSVLGGLSIGGGGGFAIEDIAIASSSGGAGGMIQNILLNLTEVDLLGAAAGLGSSPMTTTTNLSQAYGASGSGGLGGGSVIGGASVGAGSGKAISALSYATGGAGGNISTITINLDGTTLIGSAGGDAGNTHLGGGGIGGAGGGSVFGGISLGGAGGYAEDDEDSDGIAGSMSHEIQAHGGSGGTISYTTLNLSNITLTGAPGGQGGAGKNGNGANGLDGGSIVGGYSVGGAAGVAVIDSTANNFITDSDGGNGGDITFNRINLSGSSSITGNIYGGYSQGGAAGETSTEGIITLGEVGLGGQVEHNTITLNGGNLNIAGAIYGGYSINGDGSLNHDKTFTGNTLVLNGYKGSVTGVYNFEHFAWGLTPDISSGDTMISITGNDPVQLDKTQHTVSTNYDGVMFDGGETYVLIDKAQGTPTQTDVDIQEGYFLVYDAELQVLNDQLILHVLDKKDGGEGEANPDSKTFVEGHVNSAAVTQQGADMVSDYGIYSAVDSAQGGGFSGFSASSGGDNRYKTGSHVDVRDINIAVGVAKALDFPDQSTVTVGVFMEHGESQYDTYNRATSGSKIHGKGDARYTGGGVLVHYDVKGTPTVNNTDDGLYLYSAVRAGHTKNHYKSQYFLNDQGIEAQYESKSRYYSAMFGAGYAIELDEKQVIDTYARYTWSTNSSDQVMVEGQPLKFGRVHSSRLRIGGRYNYATNERVTPYLGIGYEREFEGSISASSNGVNLDEPSLRGNTGLVEIGVATKPWASLEGWTFDAGLQGFWGKREGVSGVLKLGYTF